jgi:uncharacterized glyoxalase superfamily protein PhnB
MYRLPGFHSREGNASTIVVRSFTQASCQTYPIPPGAGRLSTPDTSVLHVSLIAERFVGEPDEVEKPDGNTRRLQRSHRQKVVPHLSYEDPFAAFDWLCRVFGFTEVRRFDRGVDRLTARLKGPDGGIVMISGHDDDFKEWMRERAPHFEEGSGRPWPLLNHSITVIVDHVDAHFEQAERESAAILGAPKDQPWGVRSYAALDPEGHQWEFATVTSGSPRTPG